MKKITNSLFSPVLLAILLFLAAFFMGLATIIENDYGAAFSKATIYNTWWFELILILLTVNLLGSIITLKLYIYKIPIFLFHLSFAIILIGSGLTRYIGYEGIMHIREGEMSSVIQTEEDGFNIEISNKDGFSSQTFINKKFNEFESSLTTLNIGNEEIKISFSKYLKNSVPGIIQNPNGKPVIGFVVNEGKTKIFNYIEYGETITIGNAKIAFTETYKNEDIHFSKVNDSIYIRSNDEISSSIKKENIKIPEDGNKLLLIPNQVYFTYGLQIIIKDIYNTATIIAKPNSGEINKNTTQALEGEITYNNQSEKFVLWNSGTLNIGSKTKSIDDLNISFSYEKKQIELPFNIKLDKFEIERYPGSNSPSSFSSFVTIIQENKEPHPFHIYMNNILKLEGYRFFQSSYDNDEQGTILSVNYDIWGTTVTYIGYFLLFLGIIWSLISKNTFFKKADKLIKGLVLLVGLLVFSSSKPLIAQTGLNNQISKEHAEEFGKLLIQNNKGRTEPIYTFSSELVRKISRSESLFGLTPVQTFLEMNMDYEVWTTKPIIKISNKELQLLIGVKGKYASYNDFITADGKYKLHQKVNEAYAKKPSNRSKFDKEVMKADERINICYSIFGGNYLKIFPQQDSLNHEWLISTQAVKAAKTQEDSMFLSNILPAYYQELSKAKITGKYSKADELLVGIKKYQTHYAKYDLPSDFEVSVELAYYKWNVFKKLFPFYAMIGFIYLIILIVSIIKGKPFNKIVKNSFFAIILLGFVFHTLGLAARWYISGHAPMSNGYESLVFIAWVTIIAGIIFRKKLPLALSATSVLAALILMVANLSFMDPQITNLVPVLKSYWLTLHVSIITGSYAFLALGAILGIINQILFIAKTKYNQARILNAIREITVINHQTLIIGLYFLTIGTFLGAIWANESWGRYWGWDPKETWSLITIIVYTFVTHARLIPGIKGIFIFNVFSLYGFASVLMTYFGVNYYLSGMHSYAAGDPVPVPAFVYYSILIAFTLTTLAWYKNIKAK